ncbi:hypothetical protein IMZ48_44785, partial [Candidatus Bathyarchaeota archaeon]|nr:hypothetical protein [Candidatus Bathyarchaeota archaeon]
MSSTILTRPALGRKARLGSLYNAHVEGFIVKNLFKGDLPPGSVTTTQKHAIDIGTSKSDSYEDKFRTFGVDAETAVTFLAEPARVHGAAKYLLEERDSDRVVQSSLNCEITTVEEALDLTASGLKELASKLRAADHATHVVTGITWGSRCIVRVTWQPGVSDDQQGIETELERRLELLKLSGTSSEVPDVLWDPDHGISGNTFKVTVFADLMPAGRSFPGNLAEAREFIRDLPSYISGTKEGKGSPLTYTLMPVSVLTMFRLLKAEINIVSHQLSSDCLQRYIRLFDDIQGAQRKLHDYHSRLRPHSAAVPPEHAASVEVVLSEASADKESLKERLMMLLAAVRAGEADAQKLWDLLENFLKGPSSPENILAAMEYKGKMDFEDNLWKHGARLVGYKSKSPSALLAGTKHADAFLLYFNDHLRLQSDLWEENLAVFLQMLQDQPQDRLALAIDCGILDDPLEKPYVSHLQYGRVVVEDVLEDR